MAKKAKGDVFRLLKQIKTGVDRPGLNAARRAELTKSIKESLSSPTLDSLLDAAIDLDGLGSVEGAKGVVDIWQGEAEGWIILQTAFSYLSWKVRIYAGLFQHGRLQRGFDFAAPQNLEARCLAHAIATKEDAFANWCGRMMLDNFSTGNGLHDRWFRPFEPFIVHLFARWKQLPTPQSTLPCPPLGVYQEVLDAWTNLENFGAAVFKVCEYHAENSIEGRVAHAEFVRIPHNVFPAEILAMKRVRDEVNLPWPTIEHPLLNTPLAKLPRSLARIQNELLNKVSDAVNSVFKDIYHIQ